MILLIAPTALVATPWGLPALAWLICNPIGRCIAAVGLSAMAIWIACRIGRTAGVDRVKAQQAGWKLDPLRDRIAADETIRSKSPSKRSEKAE